MTALAEAWIGTNNAIFRLMGSLPLDTRGLEGLSTREWYLVLSNHRSWVDILVLQAVFNRRIPFLKFFLKQQLIWVPFLGLAWWALDFPFMRRYTAAYLEKHPEHRGKDLEVTRRACEKFRLIPTSVMNFVEGTRFTPAKHAAFKSPYRNLLPTRAGGTSFVLSVDGRHAALAARRDDRVLDRHADLLGPLLRPRRHRDRRRAAPPDRRVDRRPATTRATRPSASASRPGSRGLWSDKDELLDRLLK